MARLNNIFLKGILVSDPRIIREEDATYARASIIVARDHRKVENGIRHMMTDRPYLITTEARVVDAMEQLKAYDIVNVKGVITTRILQKKTFCTECGLENTVPGTITFVTPVFIEKTGSVSSADEGQEYLSNIRPISNVLSVYGMLTRDPKKISPKSGLTVTQYQMALNRSYVIRDDPPEVRADYPWVKSYGSAAEEDRYRLKKNSIVHLDGYLQTRLVKKYTICSHCNKRYDWVDKAMEIVPYETEYMLNYRSDEEIEELKASRLKSSLDQIFGEDIITEEDIEAGIDDFSED